MALMFEVPRLRDNWRRAALVSLAVLVLTGAVVALVRTGDGRGGGGRADSATAESLAAPKSAVPTTIGPAFEATGGSTAGGAAADSSAGGVAVPPLASSPSGPKIVRTAELEVRVKRGSFSSAIDRATAIATGAGGFLSSTSTSSFAKGEANGELTLRVPAARFDDVRKALGRLGTVESLDIGGEDVGGQLVDLGARLKTLRAEEASLDVLLGQARDIGQVLQVRDRLTGVRTEIEQLAGQEAALDDQVALATVQVSLHEAGSKVTPAKHGDGTAFGDSVRTAVGALVAVAGGMVIALGAALPFLVLALLGLLVARRVSRRAARA